MFVLRDYQSDSVAAAWSFLCSQRGNPVVVLPTGSGKSLVIAQLCRDAVERFGGRVIVLAHRKELLLQNAEKIIALLPEMDVGIFSAGLNSRDTEHSIVVAGIQSVYQRAFDFGERNLVIIDEVHLVPHDGEGMYKTFLNDLRIANPRLRMVGTTATPFRLDCGPLCRPDALFQKVCYSAPIQQLIASGYLCNLTTKPAQGTVDTASLRVRCGEFVAADSESLFGGIVQSACEEIVSAASDRKSVLIFCSGVNHAERVAREIERISGDRCGVVTGGTLPLERSQMLADFASRRLRWLCNVDVLTTGFDAPCIDCIAILRATMSAGLFAQICGRGFRIHPEKSDCLVLDFGQNIKRHGPIDAIDYGRCRRTGEQPGEAPTKTCLNCEIECFAGAADCPNCGFHFPKSESKHDDNADTESAILAEPESWIVEEVRYAEHHKKKAAPDSPPTMRVDYICQPFDGVGGNLDGTTISEWICVEHEGFAGKKAFRWWRERSNFDCPETVFEAVDLACRGALASPSKIITQKEGRWYRVLSAELDEKPVELVADENELEEVPF